MSENRVIGKDNKLLWSLPQDMKRFKALTTGHTVIMGRKTYESIGRVLPNRINIVISGDSAYKVPGGFVAHSLDEALIIAEKKEKEEIFIIGGGQVYTQALPLADTLYLTIVKGAYEGDTYFPDYSQFDKVISTQPLKKDKGVFIELEKSTTK